MDHIQQIYQFGDELDKLVDRFRAEYDMTYAAMIGSLQLKIHLLCGEATEDEP